MYATNPNSHRKALLGRTYLFVATRSLHFNADGPAVIGVQSTVIVLVTVDSRAGAVRRGDAVADLARTTRELSVQLVL